MSRADVLLREKWVLNVEQPWRDVVNSWMSELGVPKWRVAQRMGVMERQLRAWLGGENEPREGRVLELYRVLAEIQAEKEDSSKARYLSLPHLPYAILPARLDSHDMMVLVKGRRRHQR